MAGIDFILELTEKILAGAQITPGEARRLAACETDGLPFLTAAADRLKRRFFGNEVDLCAIVNGRSGRCPENCAFCAQSIHHDTAVPIYPLLPVGKLVEAAKRAEILGARRFAVVTSGRGMEKDREFERILEALARLRRETSLGVCCSLGMLSPAHAQALKAAGVSRYHHNVETSRAYYPQICTSHTYDEKISTIVNARAAGLEVCAGGIIGMGENMDQRLEMAFELRDLGVDCAPLNILHPIRGTKLAGRPALEPLEIIKTLALFRFILPRTGIRTAGGREYNLRDLQPLALWGGADGMLIGGYLTTGGRDCRADLTMIRDLGLSVRPSPHREEAVQ